MGLQTTNNITSHKDLLVQGYDSSYMGDFFVPHMLSLDQCQISLPVRKTSLTARANIYIECYKEQYF